LLIVDASKTVDPHMHISQESKFYTGSVGSATKSHLGCILILKSLPGSVGPGPVTQVCFDDYLPT